MSSKDINATEIAKDWLSVFAPACEKAEVDALVSCILPIGWFRDLLTFSWDLHTRHGTNEIKSYLSGTLEKKQISNVKLDSRPGLQPSQFPIDKDVSGVELAFTFETPKAFGRGTARLVPNKDASPNGPTWKALAVMMMIDNWKGHEELPYESGLFGGHTIAWEDILKDRREAIEKDPYVVIGLSN